MRVFEKSIRSKTVFVVLATTFVLFLVFYALSNLICLQGYRDLERQNIEENIVRVKEALDAKIVAFMSKNRNLFLSKPFTLAELRLIIKEALAGC